MNKTREALADYAHRTWTKWMCYLFDHSVKNKDGSVTIPEDLVFRWMRQCVTSYRNLSGKEKQSDLKEADEILKIIQET